MPIKLLSFPQLQNEKGISYHRDYLRRLVKKGAFQPLLTDTKESMLQRVTSKYYDVIDFDSVKAEMHGDIAITYGRYIAHKTGETAQDKRWFSVWFERVYAKRDGKWIYLSHRTVHGPTFGVDRQSVRDK